MCSMVDRDPEGSGFTFADVDDFDSHVRRSVVGYNDLHQDVTSMAEYFIEDGTAVYDVGCATGALLRRMRSAHHERFPRVEWIGVDAEAKLIDAVRRREPAQENLSWVRLDVTNERYEYERASVVAALFTLQFISRAKRPNVVRRIYDGLVPGGAFFVAEKMSATTARTQEVLTFTYYGRKAGSGFTPEQILGKEQALRRQLRPQTEEENLDMLRSAGFSVVEPFWRRLCFGAFLCVK